MANKNTALGEAKAGKKDEFYTQLTDIEKELRHYRPHFKGRTVLCNCDDPFESNFFKYFVLNFNRLGLKKLIATCYAASSIAGRLLRYHVEPNGQMSFSFGEEGPPAARRPYKAVVTTVYDKTGDGGVDMLDVAELFRSGENRLTELDGDGDFRSPECLELLDEADVVVTNPPFSLFRDYVATLVEHDKKFIIIGHQNALKYKEIWPLLMDNEVWLGMKAGDMAFKVPDSYEARDTRYWQDETGQKWRSLGNICWYTNLNIKRRSEEMILGKRYSPEEYPRYVNYDGIEVSRMADIPCDYAGKMGVPITFLTRHNPDQFEILGCSRELATPIRQVAKADDVFQQGGNCFYLRTGEHELTRLYDRIVIRNRHPEPPRENRHTDSAGLTSSLEWAENARIRR